jgi:nitroreductase
MLNRITKKLRYYRKQFVVSYLPKFCVRSGFLSSMYYCFFNPAFRREHRATLAGIIKHLDESKRLKANYFLLVRNTHRIEKGLLMKPKRDVFAKDFIRETIDSFENIWLQAREDHLQIKWFHDVLTEYFKSASVDEFVNQQYLRFQAVIKNNGVVFQETGNLIPYHRQDNDRSKITYEEFFKLTKQRRSVRWFLDKPVPRDLIDMAILAANQSPSACNRQPFSFRIIDEQDRVRAGVNLPMGTAGYGHTIPVFIVIVGNLDAYFDERDRHIIYIDASLAAMAMMFALETLGLSSCSINWPDIESREKSMERFLKLEKHQRPIMCMGVGYHDPEGMVAFSQKRSLAELAIYN